MKLVPGSPFTFVYAGIDWEGGCGLTGPERVIVMHKAGCDSRASACRLAFKVYAQVNRTMPFEPTDSGSDDGRYPPVPAFFLIAG